jgi:diguanylate cyclase (GGDEF)-like protein
MISLRKYLDSADGGSMDGFESEENSILLSAIQTIRSCLREMGNCGLKISPPLGTELQQSLRGLEEGLSKEVSRVALATIEISLQKRLGDWGNRVAEYYRQKTNEVKGLLIVMARTAESFGARDQRCASKLAEIGDQLETIATLEDLTQVRASIQKSAAELKSYVETLTAEGRRAITQLRAEVSSYQAKLQKSEEMASRDSLTGLRNRLWVEKQVERRVDSDVPFCVAIIDIDRFKRVNDTHGHLVGDELLQQFALALNSAGRATDAIGRWGGDEFILVLDGNALEVAAQVERLALAAFGSYSLQSIAGPLNLTVNASIGLAEHIRGETLRELLSRADSMMYTVKRASLARGRSEKRQFSVIERRSLPPRADAGRRTNKMNSLVVDDDATNREVLRTVLSEYGQCDIALDGKEAVRAVCRARENNQSYELICMDLRMPQMDGLQAVREIRKQEASAKVAKAVKIIVTTYHTDMENVAGALLGRCNAYLGKPVDISRLRRELEALGLIQR